MLTIHHRHFCLPVWAMPSHPCLTLPIGLDSGILPPLFRGHAHPLSPLGSCGSWSANDDYNVREECLTLTDGSGGSRDSACDNASWKQIPGSGAACLSKGPTSLVWIPDLCASFYHASRVVLSWRDKFDVDGRYLATR